MHLMRADPFVPMDHPTSESLMDACPCQIWHVCRRQDTFHMTFLLCLWYGTQYKSCSNSSIGRLRLKPIYTWLLLNHGTFSPWGKNFSYTGINTNTNRRKSDYCLILLLSIYLAVNTQYLNFSIVYFGL